MGRRLADIEKSIEKDVEKAEAWKERHPVGRLEMSRWENEWRRRHYSLSTPSGETEPDRYTLVPLSPYWDNVAPNIGPGGRLFVPLVGKEYLVDIVEIKMAAVVRHVLSFLLADHVELLQQRHVERLTLEKMAELRVCSYQAVQQRLNTAEDDFRKQFAHHARDVVTLTEGDF